MHDSVSLSGGAWSGTLTKVDELGASFAPLRHRDHPGETLYATGGLNFEHIFNGTAADEPQSWFTPRLEPHRIDSEQESAAVVNHDAALSSWAAESRMSYQLSDTAIDMHFRVRFHQERWPLGWIGMMWASYMQGAQDRPIHFYGTNNGQQGWTCLGEPSDRYESGFETGTVACATVDDLACEQDAALLNVTEHANKRFVHPCYYGHLDSGLAYVMMFDQPEAIRLAMWNFVQDADGRADPTRPAWDWQFIVRQPQVRRWYSYRARLVLVPFTSATDILDLYHDWLSP